MPYGDIGNNMNKVSVGEPADGSPPKKKNLTGGSNTINTRESKVIIIEIQYEPDPENTGR